MAKISKSDNAPKGDLHVVLGAADFTLTDAAPTYETDDASVISNASVNPDLKVEEDALTVEQTRPEYDPQDPHDNPASDHLSVFASQASIDAADANEKSIKDATGADVVAPTAQPSVADAVQQTFSTVVSVDAQPQLPPTDTAPTATAPATTDTTAASSWPPNGSTAASPPNGSTAATSSDTPKAGIS